VLADQPPHPPWADAATIRHAQNLKGLRDLHSLRRYRLDSCNNHFEWTGIIVFAIGFQQWIESRLRELVGIFAIECGGFSVMDDHMHFLLRIDSRRAESFCLK